MATTPVLGSGMGGHAFADSLNQGLKVFERAARKNAMAEVEDVASASACTPQHLASPRDHALGGPEKDSRVEVALHAAIEADALPARVEVDAPVERDDVRSRCRDQLEQPRGGGPEMDPR